MNPTEPTPALTESPRRRPSFTTYVAGVAGAVVALAVLATFAVITTDLAVATNTNARALRSAASDDVGPRLDNPLSDPRSFKVSCGTVDGGAATDDRVPMDGDGNPIPSESVFVSNHNATCVRVSGSDVTSTNGVEIGTAATCNDGPNVNIEGRIVKCKSEGAAQVVDVTLGRR